MTNNISSAPCTETIRGSSNPLPEWTVMVYMDADNNLHQFGINDINEMETIDSTSDLNIIVLFDGNGYGDSKIYRIVKDQNGYDPTIVSTAIDDWGKVIPNSTKEVNIVDSNTLLSFGKFVFDNYPAQHYLLSLWNHGKKLFGLSYGEDRHDINSDPIYEGNGLSIVQIDKVLENLTNYIDRKIDIVGFDACYLGFIETAYQFNQYANYFVGAEDVEPDNGWNYTFLSTITSNPLAEPAELAKKIVADYDNEYKSGFSYEKFTDNYTLAAVDVHSLMNIFIPLLNNFSSELQKHMYGYRTELRNLRSLTEAYDNGRPRMGESDYNADFYHFAELVAADTTLPEQLRNCARYLAENRSKVVIANSNSSFDANAHGASIYFPKITYEQEYNTFKFANETWDEFLSMYLNPKDVTKPSIVHEQLSQRQTIHSYNITAVITDEELSTNGVFVWYSTNGSNYSKISMIPDAFPNIYYGTIPAQTDNTTVYYYIEACDKSQNLATLPENASVNDNSSVYSFQVVIDVVPPTIAHTALKNISENSIFYPIAANITDDFNVDKNNIFVYWKPDADTDYTKVQMINYDENVFIYNIPKQSTGSVIDYYMEARDEASNPNIKRFPTSGNFTFFIVPAASSILTALIKYNNTVNETSVTYTAETSLGTYSGLRYIWSFGDGSFGLGKTIKHDYPQLGRYVANLSVIDDIGDAFCTNVTVFLTSAPVVSFPTTLLIEEGETFLFNATDAIDADGEIVNWTWDFGDGVISYGVVVNHTYADWGTYNMSLTVTDNFGAKSSSHTAVTVNKKPIVCILGAQSVAVGDVPFFSANNSYDVDGSIIYWLWDFGDGSYSYDKISSHTYVKAGTYYVNLTVVDNNSAYNTTLAIILVDNPPQAIIIAPDLPMENKLITFDGSNSAGKDRSIVNWTWDFGDGVVGYGSTVTHAYTSIGIYYVSLTVTDDLGAKNRTDKTVIVRKSTSSNIEGRVCEEIYFNIGLDSQGFVAGYRWDFGDGNITDWSNSDLATHIYQKSGTYTARFQVIYRNITTEWADIVVVVKNPPPNAKICVVKQAKVGDNILFDASESNSTYGSIVSYNWSFGDGERDSGIWITHTYSKPGTYIVNLTVVDNNSSQNSTTLVIQIDRGEKVKVAIPGFDISSVAIVAFIVLLSLQIIAAKRKRQLK